MVYEEFILVNILKELDSILYAGILSGGLAFVLQIYAQKNISPALSGASFLGLKDIVNQPIELNYLVFVAIISSFILSFMTVKFFLFYINKFSMNAFVIYRIIIALILFSLIY